MTNWQPTCELRQFDDTPKMVNTRLQQKWRRGDEFEWRDIPIVWDRNKQYRAEAAAQTAGERS